jgi:hypothetical protein
MLYVQAGTNQRTILELFSVKSSLAPDANVEAEPSVDDNITVAVHADPSASTFTSSGAPPRLSINVKRERCELVIKMASYLAHIC